MIKVAFLIGIGGAYRTNELERMTIEYVGVSKMIVFKYSSNLKTIKILLYIFMKTTGI